MGCEASRRVNSAEGQAGTTRCQRWLETGLSALATPGSRVALLLMRIASESSTNRCRHVLGRTTPGRGHLPPARVGLSIHATSGHADTAVRDEAPSTWAGGLGEADKPR